MKAGFGKTDITPQLGVEMSGFGAYRHRVAKEFRDKLYAKAMAVDDGISRWALISCDLIALDEPYVAEAREIISNRTGLKASQIMVICTHTHSGPATSYTIGWGEKDGPYIERLPTLIAQSAIQAVNNLGDAEFSHATSVCGHIAFNRDLEGGPKFEDTLDENWTPKYPEETDKEAHVIKVESKAGMTGFLSYYSCHPVSCCESTHSLHGDFCGVATNVIESQNPGSVGIFLQGAHGDINTAVCHQSQENSMLGLNVLSARYVRVILNGLKDAKPIKSSPIGSVSERFGFRRLDINEDYLKKEIAKYRQKVLEGPEISGEWRLSMVYLEGMRRALEDFKNRGTHVYPVEMQAFRLGEIFIVGAPFELYRDIKEHLIRESGNNKLLMTSVTNGSFGYAVSKKRFKEAEYGTGLVPYILGICPFTETIEDELVDAGMKLVKQLIK